MHPIDALHEECIAAQQQIRDQFRRLQTKVQTWDIRPLPKEASS